MEDHRVYMQRCLDLAAQGTGNVAPNPMVGSVVVCNGRIIGEGYHRRYGGAHAEVEAIRSVRNPSLLKNSTLYVNLEPCAHHGNTPPCADLIVARDIPRVVIGTLDIHPLVAGKGVEKLTKGGCRVETGVLEKACRDLNKRFFTFHEKKRPFVILKWAQSADGFIDTERQPGDRTPPVWITGEFERRLVHKWRAEEAAILVGTHTALKDDPRLNVRHWDGPQPVRMVLDRPASLPRRLNLFDGSQDTWIFTEKPSRREGRTEWIQVNFDETLLSQIMDILYQRNILSLFVEGGAVLHRSFMQKKCWDEARVFTGLQLFHKGIRAPSTPKEPASCTLFEKSCLACYVNNSRSG